MSRRLAKRLPLTSRHSFARTTATWRPGVRRLFSLACIASLASLIAASADAAEPRPATMSGTLRDPSLPSELQKTTPAKPTEGAALREQVERKLRSAFEAADVNRTGSLSREQARAAGLGYIDQHFTEIDRRRSGTVTFDDVKRYLKSNGAKMLE